MAIGVAPELIAATRPLSLLASDYARHCFSLPLWPDLYWVVYVPPGSDFTWNVGFENRAPTRSPVGDLDAIAPGAWTRFALKDHADAFYLVDGWEEALTMEFAFGALRYEGAFVFNLLVDWRRLPTRTEATDER